MDTLAIAARSFNSPSETFIRNHVRTIAPGATVLVCQHGSGAEQFGSPFLSDVHWHLPSKSILELTANAVRQRWRRYVNPGMGTADRQRVVAFLRANRPRALLAEYGTTGCLFMHACEEAGVPLFVHFHGFDANVLPSQYSTLRHYKRLFASARGVIVTTEFLKRRLLALGCPEWKLHVCPCGVDARQFQPRDRPVGSETVLMVSRLIPQKGPILSIRSFAKLAEHRPMAMLEIIGDGLLRTDSEAEAERLGIRDRVYFHGAKSHEFVRARLGAARMLIQHCVSLPNGGVESLGLSLIEAMACQVPVVSTYHGAIPETVVDGITGLLVNEHDVDGMAAAMARLFDNPARAAAMGAAGRRRVLENYTLDHARDRLRGIMGFPPLTQSQPEAAISDP